MGFDKPTIFSEVRTDMRIAQEEIFGPMLCLLPRETVEEAVATANDAVYGLGAGMCRAGTWTPSGTSLTNPRRSGASESPGLRGIRLPRASGGFSGTGHPARLAAARGSKCRIRAEISALCWSVSV
jgi:hypothetical protein